MALHVKRKSKKKRLPEKLDRPSIRSKAMDFLSRIRRCILLTLSGIFFVTCASCGAEETHEFYSCCGAFAQIARGLVQHPENRVSEVGVKSTSDKENQKRQALITVATSQIGVRENPLGSNRGPEVDKYNLAGGGSLRDPWCASFTAWCFIESHQENFPISPYCPDWFNKERRVETPQSGDQALVYSLSKGRYFHIICCITEVRYRGSRAIECVGIEGNTNDDGSAEGIGVFRRIRRCDSVIYMRWLR